MATQASEMKKYKAYFCHSRSDFGWVMNLIHKLESDPYKIRCAEYDRDCLGAKYITSQIEKFMEDSEFIVIVLTECFMESSLYMYQLRLAIQYSLENNEGNIVPLVYKDCDVPRCMKVFDPIHVTVKDWEEMFIQRLDAPARRFPKDSGITTRDGRISIEALTSRPTRKVMSEPFLDHASNTLSEHNFNKVRTLSNRRRGKVKFLEERQQTEKKRSSLHKSPRSSGEMVSTKRESDTKERISVDSPENISLKNMCTGKTTWWNGKRNNQELVTREITELDGASGACTNSPKVGAVLGFENYRKETQIKRKWNRATRNRRNADNLVPTQIHEARSVKGTTEATNLVNRDMTPHLQDMMTDVNIAFHGSQSTDMTDNLQRCINSKREMDLSLPGRSLREENVVTFPHPLLLSVGECAKNVRVRHGRGKARTHADMLLCDPLEC